MKKITFIIGITMTTLLLQAHSCHKDDYPSVCGNRACTEIFMAVNVQVSDVNGNPVKLDEFYTIRLKNDEKINGPGLTQPESGIYTVVDDNIISTLMDKTEGFRFIGIKNGVEVVNEIYQVTGDCCHVNKDTGKDEVVIQ